MKTKSKYLVPLMFSAAILSLLTGCTNDSEEGKESSSTKAKTEVSLSADELSKNDLSKLKELGLTEDDIAKFRKSLEKSSKEQEAKTAKENKKRANEVFDLASNLNPYILTEQIDTFNKREAVREAVKNEDWKVFSEQYVMHLIQLAVETGNKELPDMSDDFDDQLKGHVLENNLYMQNYQQTVHKLKTVENEKQFLEVLTELEAFVNTPNVVELFGFLSPGNYYVDYTIMKYQELSYAKGGESISTMLSEESFYYRLQGTTTDEKKLFIKNGRALVKEEMNRKYEAKSFKAMNMEKLKYISAIYDTMEKLDYSVSEKHKMEYEDNLKALSDIQNKIEGQMEKIASVANKSLEG